MQMKMLIHVLLLNVVIGITQATEYIHMPEVGIYYKFHTNPQTWFNAREVCKQEGAELAMPRNAQESAALVNIFSLFPDCVLSKLNTSSFVYLGFHDIFKEGEYIALKGETIQYFYHTWQAGQPDNKNNENCGTMHRTGGLNDFSCNIPAAFICQKRLNSTIKMPDPRCGTTDTAYEYAQGTGKCYKLHIDPRNWPDARALCKAEGGHLAIIRSKTEERYLVNMFKRPESFIPYSPSGFILLGFQDMYKEGQFVTVLDEKLNDIGYANWGPGRPDNYGGFQNCGCMYKDGWLDDIECTTPLHFFCELKAII